MQLLHLVLALLLLAAQRAVRRSTLTGHGALTLDLLLQLR